MVEAAFAAAGMNAASGSRRPIGDWDRDGWTLIPAFLSRAELDELRREADRLLAEPALFEQRGSVPNSARRSDRLDPVIDLSPTFAATARSIELLAVVGGILRGEPRLLKDKFIAKPPGAPGYSAHQDGAYWPGMGLDRSRMLTTALFLDNATSKNGAIECVSGAHDRLMTDLDTITDPDQAAMGRFQTVEAAAGDLLLVHAFTPHRSGDNRSIGMRRALLFTYAVDARHDLYELYQNHRARLS